jgi:hypothetical protein
MKKLIAVSVIMAGMVLMGGFLAPIDAQTGDLKPTFISPTPGVYVNGWPAFSVSYPKEWAEQPLALGEVCRVADPASTVIPRIPNLQASAYSDPRDITNSADIFVGNLSIAGMKEIKVLSDKPTKLQDGTPAQEAEIEFLRTDGVRVNMISLATKKSDVWIWIRVASDKGKIGDDMRGIAHSLKVPQGKPEVVKVPPDVQALLDQHCRAVEVGDVGKIMANYSDGYLNNGTKKAAEEQWYRYSPFSPLIGGVASNDITVTLFEPQGDRAYLTGFVAYTLKAGPPGAAPWAIQQITKEQGQWKWFGNQK